jgi:hypothetical protein
MHGRRFAQKKAAAATGEQCNESDEKKNPPFHFVPMRRAGGEGAMPSPPSAASSEAEMFKARLRTPLPRRLGFHWNR